MKKSVLVPILLLLFSTVLGQESTGQRFQLLDSENNPVPFANIYHYKIAFGTSSDENGWFSIDIPLSMMEDTIIISSIGYDIMKTTEEKLTELKSQTIVLQLSSTTLDEVTISDQEIQTIDIIYETFSKMSEWWKSYYWTIPRDYTGLIVYSEDTMHHVSAELNHNIIYDPNIKKVRLGEELLWSRNHLENKSFSNEYFHDFTWNFLNKNAFHVPNKKLIKSSNKFTFHPIKYEVEGDNLFYRIPYEFNNKGVFFSYNYEVDKIDGEIIIDANTLQVRYWSISGILYTKKNFERSSEIKEYEFLFIRNYFNYEDKHFPSKIFLKKEGISTSGKSILEEHTVNSAAIIKAEIEPNQLKKMRNDFDLNGVRLKESKDR